MFKDQELLAEAYQKILEEANKCQHAKEGCDCDSCDDCKANQKVEEAIPVLAATLGRAALGSAARAGGAAAGTAIVNKVLGNEDEEVEEAASEITYTPVESEYIYFPEDGELYQMDPYKRIGGQELVKRAFPRGFRKVKVAVGEDIHDIVPGNSIDIGTQSDKWFIVDDSFPSDHSFPALVEL